MSRIGFIGYGSMGSMLVNGFLSSGGIKPENIILSNRTQSKITPLVNRWNDIKIAKDNKEVARESELLFICVKPLDVLPVMQEIYTDLKQSIHVVSIAACVTINDIENFFSGPITKIIPSVTSEVNEGISLICHNSKVHDDQKRYLEDMFCEISKFIHIKETDFEVAADLTSCAPGLFAAIFDNFVKAGIRHSEISPDDAHQMVVSTLFGTAKLMAKNKTSFSDIIQRVATKGGITEEGVKVLNEQLPEVFNDVFQKTISKHEYVKMLVKQKGRCNE